MPSRHSHVASSTFASLSEIINLEPEREPWCAGYAPSKGRRCHARTNARGRNSAMILLREGTKALQAGRTIDQLLESLAPHVLCKSFHQDQASGLASRWKRQVRAYLDSQVASTLHVTPARISFQSAALEPSAAYIEERRALLYRRVHDTMEELKRLETIQNSQSIPSAPNSHRRHRDVSIVGSSSVQSTSRTRPLNVREQRSPSESGNQSTHIARLPAQTQVSSQTRTAAGSTSRAQGPPIVAEASRNDRNRTQNETPTNRRTVEGECGICLCILHSPQQSETDEALEADNMDQYSELTWCKACCGVNFHKNCIDQWLGADQWRENNRTPTCPLCRSNWKY